MKKFLVSMMAVITAVLLVACSNASKGVVNQYMEHPSLSATRKGFIERTPKRKVMLTVRVSKLIIKCTRDPV